jgi:hypothetical protein
LCICLFYDGISLGCLDFNQFVCFFAWRNLAEYTWS